MADMLEKSIHRLPEWLSEAPSSFFNDFLNYFWAGSLPNCQSQDWAQAGV
jgi:hypothetical protein